ncbi:MAG: translation initiation factor IF-2 [Anaerolineaceae bacterium]|nr:translation initiation factor IF-2 [Anaerolineaceae bacterium]
MSENENKKIELPSVTTVRDLAIKLNTSPIQVIKILMANGVMANINQQIDFDTAAVISAEMGLEASLEIPEVNTEEIGEVPLWRRLIENEDPKNLINRPPVVTILGHVDHGKTTLLDAIRHTDVVGEEFGGITQHIGAYQIKHKENKITFLDTPGHAAFTAMRARGAQGADIVVLVVAANDGVMPQTREAIAHARAAKVPIIVALNKIDLPEAKPDFVKQQLADVGLISDEWDGDTIIVPVSAKMKTGIEDLLEAILLIAENSKILANPKGTVIGSVIEAEMDKSRGVMVTLLVQNGTLRKGDAIAVGLTSGKIKAMFDYTNKQIEASGPSQPVLVLGLHSLPKAGDLFQVCESEREARAIVNDRKLKEEETHLVKKTTGLENLFAKFQAGEMAELRLILKTDVQGSLEPIINSLNEIDQSEIRINILHSGTGNISENDIMLATASDAIVLGFNVKTETAATRLAETEDVSIRTYEIIYRLLEDIEKALKGMLTPEEKETVLGQAEVLKTFRISKMGTIAGCRVMNGEVRRNAKVRVLRNEKNLFEGNLASLKHEKDNVKEVRSGFECGIRIKGFNDFEVGDTIESFIIEEVER